jgi:hypothetical protein
LREDGIDFLDAREKPSKEVLSKEETMQTGGFRPSQEVRGNPLEKGVNWQFQESGPIFVMDALLSCGPFAQRAKAGGNFRGLKSFHRDGARTIFRLKSESRSLSDPGGEVDFPARNFPKSDSTERHF